MDGANNPPEQWGVDSAVTIVVMIMMIMIIMMVMMMSIWVLTQLSLFW